MSAASAGSRVPLACYLCFCTFVFSKDAQYKGVRKNWQYLIRATSIFLCWWNQPDSWRSLSDQIRCGAGRDSLQHQPYRGGRAIFASRKGTCLFCGSRSCMARRFRYSVLRFATMVLLFAISETPLRLDVTIRVPSCRVWGTAASCLWRVSVFFRVDHRPYCPSEGRRPSEAVR